MKYRLIAILMAFMTILTASAAPTAADVLARSAQRLNSAKSITAKFTGSTAGTLVVSGERFSMIAGGFGVWYNGTDMWTYSKRAGETSLTTPTKAELLESNPMEIIKSYNNKYNAEKVSVNGAKYTVRLTPKAKGDNVKSATLIINTSTWLPESIDIIFANDSRLTVNITSITEGDTLPASRFAYPQSQYPGVEVVDLR